MEKWNGMQWNEINYLCGGVVVCGRLSLSLFVLLTAGLVIVGDDVMLLQTWTMISLTLRCSKPLNGVRSIPFELATRCCVFG